jgi:TetR/AcrR family transcriptional repressor of nem operon
VTIVIKRVKMRVSKQKSAENRERILTEAARLFRERGLAGVGVDALTEAAGLTHGSLYSQFGSKDGLAAEALRHAFAGIAEKYAEVDTLAAYAARYLSQSHRDRAGSGCAVAALASDMPRQSDAVRGSFTDGVRAMLARVAAMQPAGDDALATVATLVGALMLARAVDDPELSTQFLAAARESVTGV